MSTKKALVIGASGQAGCYLCQYLVNKGYDVTGTFLRSPIPSVSGRMVWTRCDVTDRFGVQGLIQETTPEEIYNLASLMYAPDSWRNPREYMEVNCNAVLNMLDLIRVLRPHIKFFQAGSAEALDLRKTPQSETTPLRPRNPYGVAKAAAQELVRVYREQHGMFACTGILFNMESPLRSPSFFSRKVASEVVRIKRQLDSGVEFPEPLKLGKLHAVRDWGYTKEYVEAMHLMLQADTSDDYVIATGYGGSCKDFVIDAFKCAGIEHWKDYCMYAQSTMEDIDSDRIVGNPIKIYNKLGWKAATLPEQLIKLMVEVEMAKEKIPV